MSSVFTPPVVYDRARTVAGRHPGNDLMRHYGGLARGVNVYLLYDGTVTTTQPYDPQGTIIKRTFFGGHVETVSDDEVALLTAAGYGAYITGGTGFDGFPSDSVFPSDSLFPTGG